VRGLQPPRGTNPLRVLDCKVPACKALVENAPSIADSLCPGCAEHFAQVRDILDSASLPYRLNDRLVRGLDYYQRTTFEVVSGEIGAQTAVAGGGRYDGLIKQLGGPDLPGIGFACGMERLALLYGEAQKPGTGLLPGRARLPRPEHRPAPGPAPARAGLCRRGVLRGPQHQGPDAPGQQAGVKTCLILGQDEMEKGQIVVKDMATGVQKNIGQDDLEQALGFRSPKPLHPNQFAAYRTQARIYGRQKHGTRDGRPWGWRRTHTCAGSGPSSWGRKSASWAGCSTAATTAASSSSTCATATA
jgi:histidyl-tRNA synthetase